jgi:hypothetical protein
MSPPGHGRKEKAMAFFKNLHAKALFNQGIAAAKAGDIRRAADLMSKSSSLLIEMMQAGESKYESDYARTEMNLGTLYNKLGMIDDSMHSFLISIRKFTVLVMQGRFDLSEDLLKAQSVFETLYPGAVMDIQRGTVTGVVRRNE